MLTADLPVVCPGLGNQPEELVGTGELRKWGLGPPPNPRREHGGFHTGLGTPHAGFHVSSFQGRYGEC